MCLLGVKGQEIMIYKCISIASSLFLIEPLIRKIVRKIKQEVKKIIFTFIEGEENEEEEEKE